MFCIGETKPNTNFSDTQFRSNWYQSPPFTRDRNSNSGGKRVFAQERIIPERFTYFENSNVGFFCKELTISKRKRCILLVYFCHRFNKIELFNYISNTISTSLNIFDTIASGLNIDLSDPSKSTSNHLSDLVEESSCFKSKKESLIDVILRGIESVPYTYIQ